MEIGPTDADLTPSIEKKPRFFAALKEIREVEIYPTNRDILSVSQKLIQDSPRMDSLSICSGFDVSPDPPSDLDDSSTEPGLITRSLFSHMRPFESCTPLTIKFLFLEKINLRYVSTTYMKLIKMPALEHLELRKCAGADALLSELSKPHQRPAGLKVLRFFHQDDDQHYGLGALEGFLRSVSGLETLHVDIDNAEAPPKDDCITRHSKSLNSLSMHAQRDSSLIWAYAHGAFNKICKECSELRQLSVTFPDTPVYLADLSEEFTNHLVSEPTVGIHS